MNDETLKKMMEDGWPLNPDFIKLNRDQLTAAGNLVEKMPIDGHAEVYVVHSDLDDAIADANKRPAKRRRRSTLSDPQGEDLMQINFIEWARAPDSLIKYPALDRLYHPANGGGRSAMEGAMMKRMGVRKGIPDLCLPVARGDYHGWYSELKFGANTLSREQTDYIDQLRADGYYVKVWYDDWQLVASDVMNYLDGLLIRRYYR